VKIVGRPVFSLPDTFGLFHQRLTNESSTPIFFTVTLCE
jgi:hypothetical protein